jgi:hypothetical protein
LRLGRENIQAAMHELRRQTDRQLRGSVISPNSKSGGEQFRGCLADEHGKRIAGEGELMVQRRQERLVAWQY